jgi:hypothetical protein
MVEYTNVILCNGIGEIGGIETFFYELGRKYGKYDITIVYNYANNEQLKRLRQYVRCVRLTKKIKCKKCFLMYNVSIDMVEAEEYIQLIHANYKVQNLTVNTDKRISKYYGVSNWVAKDYEELLQKEGITKKVEVCYNPITIDKPKKVLKLISTTRLTREKGKERMIILANMLTKAKIPFIWLIFTNDYDAIDNPNVIYMKPRLDIRNYIAEADYLVQLSDTEACPYSLIEANSLGVPCIHTPIPSLIEIGIQGYQVPFDMSNIDINKILDIPKVDYKPPKDIWNELLDHKPSTYDPNDTVEVIALKTFEDNGMWVMANQVMVVNREEAKRLEKEGYVKEVI